MNFPPGPSTSPFWQTWQWITDPIAYLETCAQAYGDFFSVNLGHILSRAIAVSNPETIQEIFTADPTIFDTFPRILNQPYQLQGYQLEPNTMLVPCVYLVHHRKDIYPEPNKFKPERFLERQYSPYEYLPFGGGNRRCIGAALALLEMKLV